jgi:hypothetical protein
LYSDRFIPINCFSYFLIIYNNLLCVRSILLRVLTESVSTVFLLLFHQTQSISTNYIELKSNESTRTNMPLPTCALFCPLLPLQDCLLQGWYSSFSTYSLLGFLPHHHCSCRYHPFCSHKQWWTHFILPIRVFPFFFIFYFTLS